MNNTTLISILLLAFLWSTINLQAQIYSDHFGTGNDIGVTVSSSSEQGTNVASHTLNGTGLFPDMTGASRFIGQATMGGNYEDIQYVTQVGIKAWLEEQFAMPTISFLDAYKGIYQEALTKIAAVHPIPDSTRTTDYLNFAFYENIIKDPEALRQKVAFALSQLFVVSTISIDERGFGMASYYDVLYQGAFGNFRDVLSEVTLHPIMGGYLSHFKNRKADPENGTLPDENFAREIMQLFTIGLVELNNDGTSKLDDSGNTVSTYDIEDIQELAKVFTGLSAGGYDLVAFPQLAGVPLRFDASNLTLDATVPMAMYEEEHESGPKTMIDGTVIPAGQPGMEDIQDALDVLFNHPNVGPFISIRLIQQLVKSNPSPSYINRIATVFNNNGQGVRGDLKAVIQAILTDPEARDCAWIDNAQSGKLKQPIERLTNLYVGFDINSPSGNFWLDDKTLLFPRVEQAFLSSPSVFNFFTPFYAESEVVEPNELVSPEFQILHSVSSIHYLNSIEFVIKDVPFLNKTAVVNAPRLTFNRNMDRPFLDFSDEITLYNTSGLDALIDRLDLIICHGQLSDTHRTLITNTITQSINGINNYSTEDVIDDVLYFMMVSPDYLILK